MKAIVTVINVDEATETNVALVEPICSIPVLARTAAVPNPRAAPRDKAIPSINKLPRSLGFIVGSNLLSQPQGYGSRLHTFLHQPYDPSDRTSQRV